MSLMNGRSKATRYWPVVPITSNVHYNQNFYCRQVCTIRLTRWMPSTGCHFLHSVDSIAAHYGLHSMKFMPTTPGPTNSMPSTPSTQHWPPTVKKPIAAINGAQFHWALEHGPLSPPQLLVGIICEHFRQLEWPTNDRRMVNTAKFTVC